MVNAKIIGTGISVPKKVLKNEDLSLMLGEDIDDFVSNTLGIRERHVLSENESTADIASEAAQNALKNASIKAEEVDLIILATDTPEYISPATSVVVQHRIGAKNAGTFDINCACAGFVTALDAACKYIAADKSYRNVLVIGAYAMTKFLDWKEKKTATIFADGAGAILLQATKENAGLLASKLEADGSYHDFLGIFAGGTKYPIDEKELAEGYRTKVRFAKKYPPEVNIEGWQRIVKQVLQRANLSLDDIKLFLWTQVNLSTIKIVMNELGLPFERTHTIMHKWGYTGSACIPMALHDAIAEGKLNRGDNFVMCASGGGLNMAAVAFRF
ncbi:MAG: ketoacyl-ACP synthase III [Acidobacteria bacterium]|jgi:3-oxoacyl-[acyl-carrier-protein] synthase-3|nr:MAG: ketoacyl-ACP synthase III [Acidobacteriota bacterium]GIU82304.1 MAG: 3-oxoacyl-[acyl-carrier-protein] synthase 3 [Pyrinomonadaceae bacterium]